SNAIQANFELRNLSGNADLYIRRSLPVPSTNSFFYASTNAGNASELIVVTNGAPTYPLAPGDWYLAVINRSDAAVDYTVAVSQFVDGGNVVTLSNALPYNASGNSCPVTPIDYYRFTVSGSAVRAQFEVLSPSEDVNLVLQKGLPLPTVARAPYQSTNSGASDELITLFT